MNKDEIIRMAREADDFADTYTPQYVTLPNEWSVIRDERFAALVAAAERKAIEPIVYGLCISDNNAQEIVDAIRKRGQG